MDAKGPVHAYALLVLASLVAACGVAACRSEHGGGRSRSSGRTLYVSTSSNCAGHQPCYASIQDAVDAAAPERDVIQVAGGVYTTTASQVIYIDKAVQLVGGYDAVDWSPPRPDAQPAIVDAERVPGRRGISIDGRGVPTITVQGFWIRRGVAQTSGGGGVYVTGGSVFLENNVIEECIADGSGGGVYISDGRVHLRNNLFRGNEAQYGAGLYVAGGNVILQRDTFVGNQAPPLGGAIAIDGGTVEGTNNVVAKNLLAGAGVYVSGGHLSATHWTVVDNGLYGIVMDLGMDIEGGSAKVCNSIIASHSSGLFGAGAEARRSLFHDVEHPCYTGASCLDKVFGDPRFVDPLDGDYHIAADSAAVDQACSMGVASDMDGDIRPVGPASDIGADEIAPDRTYLPLVVRKHLSHRH